MLSSDVSAVRQQVDKTVKGRWSLAPAQIESCLVMIPSGNLLAWIKPCGGDEYIGAFVGDGASADARRPSSGRLPATRRCASPDEARRWVEDQAAALGVPLKWVAENLR